MLPFADFTPESKTMKKPFLFVAILALAAILAGRGYYRASLNYALDPQSSDRAVVDIRQGDNAGTVASKLKEKGLIRSERVFAWHLKRHGLDQKLKAGRLALTQNMTLPQIAEALTGSGKPVEQAVTLLEGWTAQQIADHLEAEGLTTASSFMSCVRTCDFEWNILPSNYVEGYLYPDTYYVDPVNFSDEAFIDRLIGTLDTKLTEEDQAGIEASGHSWEQIMIMASIVEREERDPDERPTVAGILWNRFDAGQGLGADATVLYGLGRTSGGLTREDLQSDSPYNTRKFAGLPPTPISNPSLSSIRAAIFPAETDYWYYLHGSDGQIHYGKTLEEHNENKRRWL